MSKLNVDTIEPEGASTTLTLGASGDTVTLGTGASTSGFDSGLASVQTFTSSGTWTRPSGITKVIMEVQGAGGSGASNDPHTSGSGGGYAKKLLDVSSISTSTITVGSGGASVSAGGGAGNAGGDTSWADGTNTITGSGGLAGPASATTILGGSATGGDININGGVAVGYYGGKSFLGLSWGQDSTSPDPVGYGAGGASGATRGTYASHVGGDGIVIVWEYK